MGRYVSSITFDHNENLSCVFRNWKSDVESIKCLHGCNLSVKIIFESRELDQTNQNIHHDFIDKIKKYLHDNFYYTTIVSADDPALPHFNDLNNLGVIKLKVWPDVSIEKFAETIYAAIFNLLVDEKILRFGLKTVEVREHQGASSLYIE